MASMIGIGVAIDYSLFILARYREERRAGRDCDAARSEALATSGLAVAFSGLAVIVSLAGLWMVDNQALRSMALGAMTVVAVSILTATTLLPALIAMLGDRVMPGGIVARVLRFFKHRSSGVRGPRPRRCRGRPGFWDRWARRVMARPVLAAIGSAAVLLLLASRCSRWRRAPRRSSSSPRTATCGSATNSPPSSSAAAPTRSRSSPPSAAPPDRAAVAAFAARAARAARRQLGRPARLRRATAS